MTDSKRTYELNALGKHFERLEAKGETLYVFQTSGVYHLPGERFDDILKSRCGKTSGRLGVYGVTADVSDLRLCPECAAILEGQG
jgi:hypothetical protein